MGKQKDTPRDDFFILHNVKDGKHYLDFCPKKECSNFPPVVVEITSEQWDALRYEFITGYADKEQIQKLFYIPI